MKMRWSRREFVQWAGISSLSSSGLCSSLLPLEGRDDRAGFAYVSSSEGADEGIHAYSVRGHHWDKMQSLKSRRPVSLTTSADRRFLYAVNEVDSHEGLPVGTVEAYAIGLDGRLTFLNRSALALSATMPRHAAVAADGRSLVVAVHGGGAYNVLPIAEDGSLGRVSGILKEVGAESAGASRRAEPRMVAFDKAGRVVSVDTGTDRLNVLSVSDAGINAHTRVELQSGSSPTQVAMHPAGERLYVMHGEAIACYGYDVVGGRVMEPMQHLQTRSTAAMAVHPSGRFLYAGQRDGGVAVWSLTKRGDVERHVTEANAGMGELSAVEIAPDGKNLIGIDRSHGVIRRAKLDPDTGRLGTAVVVARLDSPSSLAVV